MTLKSHLKVSVMTMTLVAGTSVGAATIDLGFALDESGSISSSDYSLAKTGLANALDLIPTSGPNDYRVGVVKFDSSAEVVVAPTIIDPTSLSSVQAAVTGASKSSGGTDIAESVDLLTSEFTGLSGGLGDTTLFNVTTDGGSSISALQTAATNASGAGVDGLSFEAVGTFTDTSGLQSVAFPTPGQIVNSGGSLPDATSTGFVFEVDDFSDYESAIGAKITKVVEDTGGNPNVIPLPAGFPLILTGLGAIGGLGAMRKRKSV